MESCLTNLKNECLRRNCLDDVVYGFCAIVVAVEIVSGDYC